MDTFVKNFLDKMQLTQEDLNNPVLANKLIKLVKLSSELNAMIEAAPDVADMVLESLKQERPEIGQMIQYVLDGDADAVINLIKQGE